MKKYDPSKIEKKWSAKWAKDKIYEADISSGTKPKWYQLVEFPYPSGDGLHVGHVRSYTAFDILSRKRRMEGNNVMYPMGWDAFGLPAESFAIKTGVHPSITTKKNIANYKKQINSLGLSFDWSKEVSTSDPKYYKWTQWIFLQLLKHGLAYKARMPINWCPKDKIGLANEEVVDGKCERCGTPVEKRDKEQWMLAITKYAERLDKDLDTADYPDRVKSQQKNWIGRSEGAEIEFLLDFKSKPKLNENRGPQGEKAAIKVFTTRPDTIYGATFVVLAPEHIWVTLATDNDHDVLDNKEEVKAYIKTATKRSEMDRTALGGEKTGILLRGVVAINPATSEEIPIWVADYVLPHYGTGAIMAVPAHDERDFDFAKSHNLPIRQVIEPIFIQETEPGKVRSDKEWVERVAITAIVKHWRDDKYIGLKWKKVNWETLITGGVENNQTPEEAALAEIREETGYQNLKFVKALPRTHAKFFHVPKDVNRFAHFYVLYFELQDDKRESLADGENDIHEIVWLTKSEMEKFHLPASHRYSWETLMNPSTLWTGEGIMINSDKFTGQSSQETKNEIVQFIGGKGVTRFKLRDWIFSRQRYWGEPIPVMYCRTCWEELGINNKELKEGQDYVLISGQEHLIVPVSEKDLPVKLPKVEKYEPTDTGESPLANIRSWVDVKCPICKGSATRETDTMPNWAGSSWYFLAFCIMDNLKSKELVSKEIFSDDVQSKFKHWLPVDWYNGGMEHTTLHLLYSRFWYKFLYDLKIVPTSEPYKKRTSHGIVLAEGGEKMSKSRGNVVNPDDIVKTYGADTLRLYEMFVGPFDQMAMWSSDGIIGPRRFLERIWKLADRVTNSQQPKANKIDSTIHKTIKKVSEDVEEMRFNTAVSSLMVCANELEKSESVSKEQLELFLKILAPFAPFVTEEIWHDLGNNNSIHTESWPEFDETLILEETSTIAVQVNGKTRATLVIKKGAEESVVVERAKAMEEVDKWLKDKTIIKTVYVKERIINFVLG
jgi:leucyl-tRNA synthetase